MSFNLLGTTGSGKSCVANAIIQGSSCFNCCAKKKISSSFFDHIPYSTSGRTFHVFGHPCNINICIVGMRGESVIYRVPIAERL